jgi:hypothetical protein
MVSGRDHGGSDTPPSAKVEWTLAFRAGRAGVGEGFGVEDSISSNRFYRIKQRRDAGEALRETRESRRPDGALVLETGAYVCFLTGTQKTGLFAFCVDAARFATNVLTAHPDFSNYFSPDVSAGTS